MENATLNAVTLSEEAEGFISVIKLMRIQSLKSPRYRYCEEYLREVFPESRDTMAEAFRLICLADTGDKTARALVDPIAPDWEFGQWLMDGEDGHCAVCGRGGPTKSKGKGKPDAVEEPESGPYAPSTELGSAPDILWQALVALSPDGKPVEAEAWRDAALIALARSGRIANPIGAFRDAKRRLKGQHAYDETQNGAIHRKI